MGVNAEMFVRLRKPIDIVDLTMEMGDAFGPNRFWIFDDPFRPAAEIVDTYEQDGPTIVPDPGEQFLRIYPATRYYGVGYERGDLPFLISLAAWLERKTSGVVMYGGDSGGILAEPFGRAERDAVWEHFVRVGHMPYSGDPRVTPGHRFKGDRLDGQSWCCTRCGAAMRRFGFSGGGRYGAFQCLACGRQVKTDDGGETFSDDTVRER